MFGGTMSSSDPPPDPPHSRDPPRSPPPCWAAQARCDLAQAETELRRQQERYKNEVDSVKRGVERAVLGARREERRLLERVEQDHRDTQRQLEQVQRENMAAIRVSQSLLDERLRKLSKLQQQIEDGGQSSVKQNVLLKEVSDFLQPWEVSVSLKKVNFKPSSLPNAVSFGDIRVQEQSLCLHVGGCGPQGQMCALHSQEIQSSDHLIHQATTEDIKGPGFSSSTGRVAKKISISTQNQPKSPTLKTWKYDQQEWESPQDEELEQGDDVFLAVPTLLQNLDSNANAKPELYRSNSAHCSTRKTSGSPSPEHARLGHSRSFDSQDSNNGKLSPDSRLLKFNSSLASPRISPREPLISQSCLDLTSRGRPHSCLSQSSDDHSLATLCDSGRALSPTDSLDSSYTFIVSSASEHSKSSLSYNCRLSKSAVDLSRKTRPFVGMGEQENIWKPRCSNYNASSGSPSSPMLSRSARFGEMGQKSLGSQPKSSTGQQQLVSRSLSMSVIDGSSDGGCRRERGQPALREMEEDEGEMAFEGFGQTGVRLVRQFGKQGSGRSDMTLPSGIHATPQGQLFIVDCGNSRIQVTDSRGNVLQQIGSQSSGGSSRRCRNYFDIAVNSKGLIALSCAAERALLVFSRHGRLLQTYGGSGSTKSPKDELEAPRGVTVTQADEFLVADIRKGTLIALKLEPKTGSRMERTVVTGFHRPYLVAACPRSGAVAVSERGNETGRVPCIKVLAPDWNTIRVLGVCAGMGPVLVCPWGICIDGDGDVLVADWTEQGHRIVSYPSRGVGRPVITEGLSSPRGLTVLAEGHLAVSDSMHHCVKVFQYKRHQE